ncbi:imidazole glycerol phosphate synthase subunit HisH [soil metagenome]
MITLIDYGIGNLRSLEKAFTSVGIEVERTGDQRRIATAQKLVLPGVGAFGRCSSELSSRGLDGVVRDAAHRGVPLLGVCVGMQLLFRSSTEFGDHPGLGLLDGEVKRFRETDSEGQRLKIPHVGWNSFQWIREHPLAHGVASDTFAYFVHSYRVTGLNEADVLAECTYGERFPAIVGRQNVLGIQFHPEKSQATGLQLLHNFATQESP